MMYAFIAGGFVLLFLGGELLVRGAVGISRRLGISSLLIGLTVVAFGTSAPELLVSVKAALAGNADISLGNVVGSNIANVLLIMGLAALIKPITVDRSDIRSDALTMVGASVVLLLIGFTGELTRWMGALLFVGIVVYVVLSYRHEIKRGAAETDWHAAEADEFTPHVKLPVSIAFVAGGLVALVLGADWLVTGALQVGEQLGVPAAVLGLTVVAVGTSLPELATSVVAAYKGHSDVAVGNVVGSNTFNILLILGITGMIVPIPIADSFATVDIPIMAAVAVFAAAGLLVRGRFGRIMGASMVLTWVAYTAWLYMAA